MVGQKVKRITVELKVNLPIADKNISTYRQVEITSKIEQNNVTKTI